MTTGRINQVTIFTPTRGLEGHHASIICQGREKQLNWKDRHRWPVGLFGLSSVKK